MKRLLAATTVASILCALPALSQTTTPSSPPRTDPPAMTTPRADTGTAGQVRYLSALSNEMRASRLMGTSVRNTAGEAIGNINEILIDKSGKIAGVVIGVGGFLGIGEREVAVNFELLQSARDKDGRDVLTMNVTRDALTTAPAWTWPKS